MTAALSHSYRILGKSSLSIDFKEKTRNIIEKSNYWQMRVRSFPEIMTLAGFEKNDYLLKEIGIKLPLQLIPNKYLNLFSEIHKKRELNDWKD